VSRYYAARRKAGRDRGRRSAEAAGRVRDLADSEERPAFGPRDAGDEGDVE